MIPRRCIAPVTVFGGPLYSRFVRLARKLSPPAGLDPISKGWLAAFSSCEAAPVGAPLLRLISVGRLTFE
jgi:hypothetical protein